MHGKVSRALLSISEGWAQMVERGCAAATGPAEKVSPAAGVVVVSSAPARPSGLRATPLCHAAQGAVIRALSPWSLVHPLPGMQEVGVCCFPLPALLSSPGHFSFIRFSCAWLHADIFPAPSAVPCLAPGAKPACVPVQRARRWEEPVLSRTGPGEGRQDLACRCPRAFPAGLRTSLLRPAPRPSSGST